MRDEYVVYSSHDGKPHSTQLRRRSALAFTADLAAGKVPNTPVGTKVVASNHPSGAELVTPDGVKHPLNSWWCLSRIMAWWDDKITDQDRLEMIKAGGINILQVNRRWAGEVSEWLAIEAWAGATDGQKELHHGGDIRV